MSIRVFAAGANPAIDQPVRFLYKHEVDWLVKLGSVVWVSKRIAQYRRDRQSYVAPPVQAKPSFANLATIDNRKNWQWKKRFSGPVEVLQLVP